MQSEVFDMRVVAVQLKGDRGDVAAAQRRSVQLALEASTEGADLIVLPEMACSGYIFESADDARAVAEPAKGPTFEAWREVAIARESWVVGGFPEDAGKRMFNSALVINPAGELVFTYRKTMLYDADRTWAWPGDSGYRRFQTPFGAFGVGICMDLNDPRFLLWCWRNRLDAVAFPTNWVEEGIEVWPYWRERMGGSGAALVAANTWGDEAGTSFTGCSAVLYGDDVLVSAPKTGDAFIRAELSLPAAVAAR